MITHGQVIGIDNRLLEFIVCGIPFTDAEQAGTSVAGFHGHHGVETFPVDTEAVAPVAAAIEHQLCVQVSFTLYDQTVSVKAEVIACCVGRHKHNAVYNNNAGRCINVRTAIGLDRAARQNQQLSVHDDLGVGIIAAVSRIRFGNIQPTVVLHNHPAAFLNVQVTAHHQGVAGDGQGRTVRNRQCRAVRDSHIAGQSHVFGQCHITGQGIRSSGCFRQRGFKVRLRHGAGHHFRGRLIIGGGQRQNAAVTPQIQRVLVIGKGRGTALGQRGEGIDAVAVGSAAHQEQTAVFTGGTLVAVGDVSQIAIVIDLHNVPHVIADAYQAAGDTVAGDSFLGRIRLGEGQITQVLETLGIAFADDICGRIAVKNIDHLPGIQVFGEGRVAVCGVLVVGNLLADPVFVCHQLVVIRLYIGIGCDVVHYTLRNGSGCRDLVNLGCIDGVADILGVLVSLRICKFKGLIVAGVVICCHGKIEVIQPVNAVVGCAPNRNTQGLVLPVHLVGHICQQSTQQVFGGEVVKIKGYLCFGLIGVVQAGTDGDHGAVAIAGSNILQEGYQSIVNCSGIRVQPVSCVGAEGGDVGAEPDVVSIGSEQLVVAGEIPGVGTGVQGDPLKLRLGCFRSLCLAVHGLVGNRLHDRDFHRCLRDRHSGFFHGCLGNRLRRFLRGSFRDFSCHSLRSEGFFRDHRLRLIGKGADRQHAEYHDESQEQGKTSLPDFLHFPHIPFG